MGRWHVSCRPIAVLGNSGIDLAGHRMAYLPSCSVPVPATGGSSGAGPFDRHRPEVTCGTDEELT